MSRIGLKVINVPESVTVTKNGDNITVKGSQLLLVLLLIKKQEKRMLVAKLSHMFGN